MIEAPGRSGFRDAPYKTMPIRVPEVQCTHREDGAILLQSDYHVPAPHRSLVDLFQQKARLFPQRAFIARREQLANGSRGEWQRITYGDSLQRVRAIAQALIDRGCGPDRSIMVLSGPSIEHALLMMAAFAARTPYTPLSPGYSQAPSDVTRLRYCFDICQPTVIFADDGPMYQDALKVLSTDTVEFITVKPTQEIDATSFSELLGTAPTAQVDASIEAISPGTHARTIFTSGSTGAPKGVIHTHGMMTGYIAQQEAMCFYEDETECSNEIPTGSMLAWLPWSHVGGANNFCTVINSAAALYIDEGRPVSGDWEESLRNLRTIALRDFPSPPALFAPLTSALERDTAFRDFFFSKLCLIIYGGASLSQDVLDRLQKLAVAATGYRIPITTKYGSTECMGITQSPHPLEQTDQIGVPNAGVTVKLAPCNDRLEVRVKGPCVTPGYLRNPTANARSFDEEGFFCTGDAACLADPQDPAKGLVFDGRVVENFKLSTGTWVRVGQLRTTLIEKLSIIQDCVIAGHHQDDVRVLAWLRNFDAARLAGISPETPTAELIRSHRIIDFLTEKLRVYNSGAGGSSRQVKRLILMSDPPTEDEVADKGYINQLACLKRRKKLVEILYRTDFPPVISDCINWSESATNKNKS